MDGLHEVCEGLLSDSNSLAVLVLDKDGRQLARAGDVERISSPSISSLFAGNVTAANLIERLLADGELSGQFHQDERTHLHLSLLAKDAILVVLFDARSSLGLVRLRCRKATQELNRILARGTGGGSPAAALKN